MLAPIAPVVVHSTSGLLFIDKPPGVSFHSSVAQGDVGLMHLLRKMCVDGFIDHDDRLFPVHRLDRVTSGLLMVAKTPAAAAAAGELLRSPQTSGIHKYYVALSGRKPSKKMGKVIGDMERSRRGSWKLLRSTERPAVTSFLSESLADDGEAAAGAARLRAFVLKPQTGKTHQLRVALKALGSPILGDPTYAAAADAASEERTYLHAAALRLPGGHAALCDSGDAIEVRCRPSQGERFRGDAFCEAWDRWFELPDRDPPGGYDEWFPNSPIASVA